MTGRAPQFKLPPGVLSAAEAIASRDDLLLHFAAGEKPSGPFQVGVELEFLPLLPSGEAAPHAADGPSVTRLLREIITARGYAPVMAGDHLVGLQGHDGPLHLEPGAQVEIALPPRRTAADIYGDLLRWRSILREAAKEAGILLVPIGLQPVTPVASIGWNPRQRYRIMRAHLGARGSLAHHMMKATAGTQYNLDHASEADAASLVRAALAASPFVNALFANSPLEEGRPNDWLTIRPHVWRHVDPARTGYLPWVHDEGFTYSRMLDWALSADVMFVLRDDAWVAVGDITFEDFLVHGHPAAGPARREDFALHLTTLFPEVRLKQHVEIRGADSADIDQVAAGAALWRGLLYDAGARAECLRVTAGWTAAERDALFEATAREGLRATIRGMPARDLARELIDISAAGLRALDGPGGADADLLEPLRSIAASGVTPAERLLEEWSAHGVPALLRRG